MDQNGSEAPPHSPPPGGGQLDPEGQEQISSNEEILAAQLKAVDEDLIVVAFDDALLRRKCLSSSDNYDDRIDLTALIEAIFRPDEWWESRDLMYEALKEFGKVQGFTPKIQSNTFRCNRSGEKEYKRNNYSAGPLQVGCTLLLRLKARYNVVADPQPQEGSKKPKPRPNWKSHTCVVMESSYVNAGKSTCYEHGGNCIPSRRNLVVANERSGAYIKKTSSTAIYTLCNMAEEKRLTSSTIKSVIAPIWPKKKEVTPKDVFYIRAKVMKLLPLLRENPEYEAFKEKANDSDLLGGLDDEIELGDDMVHELAKELWLDVLRNNPHDRANSIVTFGQYMKLIQSQTKGFVYEFATDSEGEANGVVWQTATMRSNFERYGGYIALDTMKRSINKWLWPYMAISMYNEHRKLCLGCEGIMIGERADAYRFMCTFLINNTPGRQPEEVKIFSGDGFFDEETVRALGFVHALFLKDWYHLFDSGLKDHFGQAGESLLRGELAQMIKASTEEYYNAALANARTKLARKSPRDLQLESKLDDFVQCRHQYAQFEIDRMPGSRGLHGAAMSEQNNSSVLCNLNDGHVKNNTYCEQRVSFVGRNGLEDPRCTNVIVNGMVMNQIITDVPRGVRPKAKYVFDWTSRISRPAGPSQASAPSHDGSDSSAPRESSNGGPEQCAHGGATRTAPETESLGHSAPLEETGPNHQYSLHPGDLIEYAKYHLQGSPPVQGIVTKIDAEAQRVVTNLGVGAPLDYDHHNTFKLIHSEHSDAPPVGTAMRLDEVNLIDGNFKLSNEEMARAREAEIEGTAGGSEMQYNAFLAAATVQASRKPMNHSDLGLTREQMEKSDSEEEAWDKEEASKLAREGKEWDGIEKNYRESFGSDMDVFFEGARTRRRQREMENRKKEKERKRRRAKRARREAKGTQGESSSESDSSDSDSDSESESGSKSG